MHWFTTQTNEALNNSQAVVTPKAKVFHESRSFHYRHAIVIGSHNWRFQKYWIIVFCQLGISPSIFFRTYLEQVDRKKSVQKNFHSKIDTMRRRAHKQEACEKKLLYEDRTAEYGAGIGLNIGRCKEVKKGEEDESVDNSTPKRTRAKRTACRCGSTTHLTARHHSCPLNKKNMVVQSETGLAEETI